MKKRDTLIIIITVIITVLGIIFCCLPKDRSTETPEEITYSKFLELCEAGDVDTVFYNTSNEYMLVTIFNDETRGMTTEERISYDYPIENQKKVQYPAYENFRLDMLSSNINLSVIKTPAWVSIVSSILSVVIFILCMAVIMLLFSRMMTQSFKLQGLTHKSTVKFDDIIGHDEIIEDLKFIVKLIKTSNEENPIGVRTPKGLLLSGQPGTGKTMLAKAIANEAGVPFLYMNASRFIELYVGVGAKRVRELFKRAKKCKPCVIFIDELDAIGLKRGSTPNSSTEDSQTLTALLQELDGFTGRDGIFVIAATNRPECLDTALTRTNRFDREVKVMPPRDYKVRMKMFEHYLSNYATSKDVDITSISKQTTGFTGSDIESICNEAGIIALMHDKTEIDTGCLYEAIDKTIFKGNRSKREQFEKDKKIVAYHEAGHAVASYLLGLPVARISIQSTITGVGGAVHHEDLDTCFYTKEYIEKRTQVCLAGRVSEDLKFDTVTTGATNDIEQATEMLKAYVGQYGFDSKVGMVNLSTSLEDKKLVSDRVKNITDSLYESCCNMLEKNYNLVELVATELLENDSLSGDDVMELFCKQ